VLRYYSSIFEMQQMRNMSVQDIPYDETQTLGNEEINRIKNHWLEIEQGGTKLKLISEIFQILLQNNPTIR